MKPIIYLLLFLQIYRQGVSEIRDSFIVNKLIKIKPVGRHVDKVFLPLTELPPPRTPHFHNGRRHFQDDCDKKPESRVVNEGPKVELFGEYYDDHVPKTIATVIIPDHIDHKHFEVTTSAPYFTIGPIEAIGYHPSTIESEHPSECEKIYQDHLDDQYSDETTDYSEESLEMARMPLMPEDDIPASLEDRLYSDIDI